MDEMEDRRGCLPDAELSSPGACSAGGIDGLSLAAFAAVESLPAGERLAFVLHDVFGLRFEEIEALVGRSPFAACELAERGRARLRGSFPSAD